MSYIHALKCQYNEQALPGKIPAFNKLKRNICESGVKSKYC